MEAQKNRRSAWISNSTITDSLKSIRAKHVMVMADSCYSGRLVRGLKVSATGTERFKSLAEKKARVVITSGGLEPVEDNNGSGHSPFTDALIKSLTANQGVMDGNLNSFIRSYLLSTIKKI